MLIGQRRPANSPKEAVATLIESLADEIVMTNNTQSNPAIAQQKNQIERSVPHGE